MKRFITQTIVALLWIALVGCATTSKVTKIDPGMNKSQVVTLIGRPLKKASFRDAKGNQVDVWSYQETMWDNGGFSPNKTIISSDVVFVNGIVSKIGTGPDQHLIYNPVIPAFFGQPVNVNGQSQPQFMPLGHQRSSYTGTITGPNGQTSTYQGTSY